MVEAEAFAFFACCQQECSHGGRLSDTDCRNRSLDVAHGVKDRHAGRDNTAGRVDVQMDILVRIFGFQEQQLGDDQVGNVIINAATQKNNPFFEQAGIDVI